LKSSHSFLRENFVFIIHAFGEERRKRKYRGGGNSSKRISREEDMAEKARRNAATGKSYLWPPIPYRSLTMHSHRGGAITKETKQNMSAFFFKNSRNIQNKREKLVSLS